MKNTLLNRLQLTPLPNEGGFYREVLKYDHLSGNTIHSISTILYTVTPQSFSALHRLIKPEIYFYQGGKTLEIFTMNENGESKTVLLGPNPESGEVLQFLIEPGIWQGSRIFNSTSDSDYSLISALVFPKFEWQDFELGKRNELLKQYPMHSKQIQEFTHATE